MSLRGGSISGNRSLQLKEKLGILFLALSLVTIFFQNCAGFETESIGQSSNQGSLSDREGLADETELTETRPPGQAPAPSAPEYKDPEPVTPNPPNRSGFKVGQHFSGHPNASPRENGPVLHQYSFARTHDHEFGDPDNTVGIESWWVGPDLYRWNEFDDFKNYHRKNGAKILIAFFGSPSFSSLRPNEKFGDPNYNKNNTSYRENYPYPGRPGLLAPPKDMNSFGRMVRATVQRYKNDIYAVECWNEPFAETPDKKDFFSGNLHQLAQVCKQIYQNTKAVDPSLPVICPAQAYLTKASVQGILTAETSPGNQDYLFKYCDWLGIHPYGHTATPGVGASIEKKVSEVRGWMKESLRLKGSLVRELPLAVTEWGVSYSGDAASKFQALSDPEKGQVLYDTLKKAKELDLRHFAFYAYDNASYESGYLGLCSNKTIRKLETWTQTICNRYNKTVADWITRAVNELATAN